MDDSFTLSRLQTKELYLLLDLKRLKTPLQKSSEQNSTALTTTQQHILVLDDEQGVAELVSDILKDNGFVVTPSISPRDALNLIERISFDGVISDYKMPDMTGEQLYGAMQTLSPKMITKIGFMTGHSISFSVRSFFGRTERPYIEKPIIVKELLSLITKLKKDND